MAIIISTLRLSLEIRAVGQSDNSTNCTGMIMSIKTPFLFFVLASLLALPSCRGELSPPKLPPLPPPQLIDDTIVKEQLPDDYVVLIDNSRSIRGQQQIILREAAKVLADIAMQNDRISVVTFGEGAGVLLTKDIKGEKDRTAIRQAVKKIDFSGNKSDMTAAFVVLRENEKELFRRGGATQNIIILSDGLLESSVRKPGPAIDELQEIATRNLSFCQYFPIGLGNTTINKTIAKGRPETGMTLMKGLTARGGAFFHAESFNQVYGAILRIFRQTKGLMDGDAPSGQFSADETIERIMIIVPKQDADGNRLAQSNEITFTAPNLSDKIRATSGRAPYGPDSATRIAWNASYESFDLIAIEKPEPGRWRVNAPAKAMKGVLQLVIDRTRILQAPFSRYYREEDRWVTTALYDIRTRKNLGKPIDATFILRKNKSDANPSTLKLTPANGGYVLPTTALEKLSLLVGHTYEYRFQFTGRDGFVFSRETTWKTLSAYEPLLSFSGKTGAIHQEVVNFTPSLCSWKFPFAPVITMARERKDFKERFGIVAPQVTGQIWWSNPETHQTEVFHTLALQPRQTGGSITYRNSVALPPGAYAIVYSATGPDAQGHPREIRLRPVTLFVVDHGCTLSAAGFLALLFITGLIRRRIRLRIRGRLTMAKEKRRENNKWRFEDEVILNLPKNHGTLSIPKALPNADFIGEGPHFRIHKSIPFFCFGRPGFWLEAIDVELKLEPFDDIKIGPGTKTKINRNNEFISIINEHRYTVELNLR